MKKFIFTALLGASALAFASGAAMAEGKAALEQSTTLNSDSSPSQADNSVAHGAVDVNTNAKTISATSTTGTADGTASGTIDSHGNAAGQVGTKDGDDDASAKATTTTTTSDKTASDEAKVDKDMTSKTGIMKTRAKGAMGMLSKNEVKTVQENLSSAGYSVKADGVWGAGTKSALKEYQKSKQLNVTGKMDKDTRASMGMSND